jgi:hypothetical protein
MNATTLSLREVSEQLSSRPHVNTIRRWILRGCRGRRLAATMIGGTYRVSPDDLAHFLDTPPASIPGRRQLSPDQRHAKAKAEEMFS